MASNGDILCTGNYIDGGSRRIERVCRSPLASEAIGLGNAADLGMFVRVLIIEMIGGVFLKELVGPSRVYRLVTPFGASPSIESVLSEMQEGSTNAAKGKLADKRSISESQEQIEKGLMTFAPPGEAMLSLRRMLLLAADSANCYASLLCGDPSREENVFLYN